MSSLITTERQVDPAVELTAAYQLSEVDRRYLDDQIRGCQQHLVDSLVNGRIGTWYEVSDASDDILPGDVLCAYGDPVGQTVTKATLAAVSAAGRAVGIALTPAPAGGSVRIIAVGIVGADITELAVGDPGPVRVNTTTGRPEKVATFIGGDFPLGFVDATGALTLGVENPVGATIDHGSLTGLLDDDHTQYVLVDGTRAFTGTVGGVMPTLGAHLATKDYVDSVAQGLEWKEPVISRLDVPPGSPGTGDRYLVIATATGAWAGHEDDIAEWNGSSWDFDSPDDGWATWVEDVDQLWVYTGSSWVQFGATVSHATLQGLSADDHTQYSLVDGTRAYTGVVTMPGLIVTSIATFDTYLSSPRLAWPATALASRISWDGPCPGASGRVTWLEGQDAGGVNQAGGSIVIKTGAPTGTGDPGALLLNLGSGGGLTLDTYATSSYSLIFGGGAGATNLFASAGDLQVRAGTGKTLELGSTAREALVKSNVNVGGTFEWWIGSGKFLDFSGTVAPLTTNLSTAGYWNLTCGANMTVAADDDLILKAAADSTGDLYVMHNTTQVGLWNATSLLMGVPVDLNGQALQGVNYSPSNYTPSPATTLDGHLTGIDGALGALHPTEQQIFYVGKHGNDSNAGTSLGAAKLTLAAAIAAAVAATPSSSNQFTIRVVDAGVYSESVTLPGWVHLDAPQATIIGATSITPGGAALVSRVTVGEFQNNASGQAVLVTGPGRAIIKARRIVSSSSAGGLGTAGTTPYVDFDVDTFQASGLGAAISNPVASVMEGTSREVSASASSAIFDAGGAGSKVSLVVQYVYGAGGAAVSHAGAGDLAIFASRFESGVRWNLTAGTTELVLGSLGSGTESSVVGLKLSVAGQIRESGGPTDLTWGAIADGQHLVRSGTSIVGAAVLGGDVVGPGSATDNALARFDTTTGKLIQNSVGILTDAGILSGITGLWMGGSGSNGDVRIPDGGSVWSYVSAADRKMLDWEGDALFLGENVGTGLIPHVAARASENFDVRIQTTGPTDTLVATFQGTFIRHDVLFELAMVGTSDSWNPQTTSSASLTIDSNQGNFHRITLDHTITSLTLTAPTLGAATRMTVKFIQGSTGGSISSWPATVRFPSGIAPTFSTATGAVDFATFVYDSTGPYWDAVFTPDFQ